MKICGACGLGLDRSCFSNKQWQQSKQKRRCKECVSKGAGTSETQAEHGAGDREETAASSTARGRRRMRWEIIQRTDRR